ncbi:MAG: translation initiation factor [Caldilineaceae bacterium]
MPPPPKKVFSTDPDPEQPSARSPQLDPATNPAAAIKSRQLNTPVRVHLEKAHRGGKTVSISRGVLSPPAGKEALLKLLKTRLGTGGAIKGDDIEIQGDHRPKIVELLNDLGYKAKSAGG